MELLPKSSSKTEFLTKNITIEVPPKVVYEALMEIHNSTRLKQYWNDLDQGSFNTQLLKNVPYEELAFGGSNIMVKAEWRYSIRSVKNFSEITITIDFKPNTVKFLAYGFEKAVAQSLMANAVTNLLLLEKGYKNEAPAKENPKSKTK